jgi:multidrug efflux pump subunit AcrB
MFGKITEFAIGVNRITVLVLIGIPLLGLLVFLDYPRKEDPSIEIRQAVVTVAHPGMDARQFEDLITRTIEEKVREIGEVKDIWSSTMDARAVIHVEVHDWVPGRDIPDVWQTLRNYMGDVARRLPDGTQGPFVNDRFGLTAVATIALWADGFSLEDMRRVARDVRRQLDALTGVETVELFGVQPERVFLDVSNAGLASLGIPPAVIVDTLRAQNLILPGGIVDADGQNIIVEPSGTFRDMSDIEEVLIPLPDGGTLPLKDVVKVRRGFADPPERPVFYNGRPAIVLSVSILEGVNAVEFGDRLSARIDAIQATLPVGYVLEFATFQPALVERAVNGAISNLGQTLIIVLVVVIVFLGVRTGLIVGSFIPMTMLLALIGMSAWGVELQRMSIATMIIALGMMVDNAIVIAEAMRNRIEAGEDRRAAAIATGRELGLPLLTSTLTTILAFMPIALAEGSAGEYTLSLGQVVILVLLGSWFMSLYMTPTMAYWFLKSTAKAADAGSASAGPVDAGFYRLYRRLLEGMLARRVVCVVGVAAFVAAVVLLASRFLTNEFFPPNDRNQFLVYVDLEAGSNIEATADVMQSLGTWLRDRSVNPEVTGTVAYAGAGGPRFFLSLSPIDPDPHVAFMLVETETSDQVPMLVERTRRHIVEVFPEAEGRVSAMWLGPTETGLVEIRLIGEDDRVLLDRAETLMAAFRAVPGTLDIRQDWANPILKVKVEVDQARARRAGVTSADIAASLNAFVSGGRITEFRDGDAAIPILLRGDRDERTQLASLFSLNVHAQATGANVPLAQIAEITGDWGPYRIARRNLERAVTVSAKHPTLKADQLVAAVEPAIEGLALPPGYRWEIGGELESASEARGHLFANFPLAGCLIVLLLVWQFNSYRRAAIILISIPLAFSGAFLALLAFGAPFGFMPLLGLLSLAGIITNNGIVLIDSIERNRREGGMDAYSAIVAAAVSRLRPILLMTITTIPGLLPLIVWRDPLFYGLALVIAGGVLIGTVLTLVITPVLYSLFFRAGPPPRRGRLAPADA